MVSTTCEVRAPAIRTIEGDDGDRVELVAKLRWQVDGKTFTTFEPMVLDSARAAKRAELEQRYPQGTRIECMYIASRPNAIAPTRPSTRRSELWWLAIGSFIAAAVLIHAAYRMWRQARGSGALGLGAGGPLALGSGGPLGFACVAAIIAAMLIGGALGITLGVIAGVCLIALTIYEVCSTDRVFERVRAKLHDARHWPKDRGESGEGLDLYAADRVTGTYRGRRVWIALNVSGATLEAELPGWSSELGLERRVDAGAPGTGDAAFDELVQLSGDAAAWRPVLSSALRQQLTALFRRVVARVERGRIVVELTAVAAQLPKTLDAVTSLDVQTVDDREARVFELAAGEPVAAVRFGHYQWLVERGWNAPRVFRAAAADRDPEIAAWGKEQLPPDAGAFR